MHPQKRNIVDGVSHIAKFVKALPLIATYINACYNEAIFLKAYENFMQIDMDAPNANQLLEIQGSYILKGKDLQFVIQFEQTEMLYFWYVRCPNEVVYLNVKNFLLQIFGSQ